LLNDACDEKHDAGAQRIDSEDYRFRYGFVHDVSSRRGGSVAMNA